MRQACLRLAALWFLPLLILLWLKGQGTLTIQRLTVDPSALAGVPAYTGILSNLGVYLWLSTASILLFGAWVKAESRSLMLLPGCLSLLLGLDDGLMLHEELFPAFLHLDDRVVQPGLYTLYALALGLLMGQLRPRMAEPGFLILLGSVLCLGSSVTLDMLKESNWLSPRHPLMLDEGLSMWLEDGLKLLGIVAWWGYWTDFVRDQLRRL